MLRFKKGKIFVASSFQEFADIREVISQIISEVGYEIDLLGPMEGLTLEEVIDECQRRAARSELLILLLGKQWGHGVTEKEFRAAKRAGCPILVYATDEEPLTCPEMEPHMKSLREEMADFSHGQWVKTFRISAPDRLRKDVRDQLLAFKMTETLSYLQKSTFFVLIILLLLAGILLLLAVSSYTT